MAVKLGTTSLGALYLGSTAISTAYLGSVQVYDAGGAAFDPASLFASGEEGVWYEPSTSTCFTDTAGTTPATYGDAVAYLQDKSGNGNHATQSTATARPTLARVPEGGRRNLLTTSIVRNADFDTFGASLNDDATTPPSLTAEAAKLVEDSSTGVHRVQNEVFTAEAGTVYVGSYVVKAGERTKGQLGRLSSRQIGTGSGSGWIVSFDLSAGTATATGTAGGIISLGGGWYRIWAAYDISSTGTASTLLYLDDGTGTSYTGDGSSGMFVAAAQLEVASTVSDYQEVVSEYDITEAGADSLDYLYDDETDDTLPWTAPADTDYTISYVNTSGTVTTLTSQSLSGATDILLDPALVAYVAVDRALTAGETTDLETYLGALA